jgi:lipid A 3-O-deacylase
VRRCLAILWLLALGDVACAGDLLVNYGAGPQRYTDQRNETTGIDYNFRRFERSARQHIDVGVSYTRLSTNTAVNNSLYAISVYPQMTFWPTKTSKVGRHSPSWGEPFFFVRALGPTYISENALGTRQQAHHFSLQAGIGVGVLVKKKTLLMVSWKHFSNANIFSDNDGFDVPLVLHVGLRF